jgi:hypothetical protein
MGRKNRKKRTVLEGVEGTLQACTVSSLILHTVFRAVTEFVLPLLLKGNKNKVKITCVVTIVPNTLSLYTYTWCLSESGDTSICVERATPSVCNEGSGE